MNPRVNGSLSPSAIRAIVRLYGARIGVPGLNPHDLRRSFAKAARDNGCPLETVQASLGHASLNTTSTYLKSCDTGDAGNWIPVDGGKP